MRALRFEPSVGVDLDAADFRAGHLAYWTKAGETVTDDTMVVTVYFDLLPEVRRASDR